MCPTVLGRVETRISILIGPALLGAALWAITGKPGYLELIGVLLAMGIVLDVAFHPFFIKWQPPWLTGLIAVEEFILLYLLAKVLEVDLTPAEAIVFYWVSWALAIATKIVVLPIVSLGWIENGGEFRATDWTLRAAQQPLPLAGAAAVPPAPPPLAREFSSIQEIPAELRDVPSPSAVHEIPAELRGS